MSCCEDGSPPDFISSGFLGLPTSMSKMVRPAVIKQLSMKIRLKRLEGEFHGLEFGVAVALLFSSSDTKLLETAMLRQWHGVERGDVVFRVGSGTCWHEWSGR